MDSAPAPDSAPALPPGRHELRPGQVLWWGPAASLPGALRVGVSTPPAVVLLWILDDDAAGGGGRMVAFGPDEITREAGPAPAGGYAAAITLDPAALHELLTGDQSAGATALRVLAADGGSAELPLPLGPSARFALESIRRCPFAGACRAMALAARANDLLVTFLTALAARAVAPAPGVTRRFGEQVRAAAALLAQHLESPPPLAELARQAGLSETSLKRGFRQVFGTTAFGYLRARRMERARALLEAGEATVLEAAALVGYSNPSHFSAAFRREFGVNPKAFQLTARG